MSATIVSSLKDNVERAYQLAEFDHLVLGVVSEQLKALNTRLQEHGLENPRLTVERTLAQIESIRDNDSLRPHYVDMLNQCVVLLVSYFGAALSDLFRWAIEKAIATNPPERLRREALTVSIEHLYEQLSTGELRLGELLVAKRDISFQDMQSVHRA